MKIKVLATLTLVTLVFASSVCAQGYLLQINVSNPRTVVVTTTGNFASTSNSSTTSSDGIDLLQFFTFNTSGQNNNVGGALEGGGSGQVYNTWVVDNASGNSVDLNLYDGFGGLAQNFTTSSEAFTGSATIDLSSILSYLPTVGTTGNILSGYSGTSGVVIGQWEVTGASPTPEPSTLALGGIGAILATIFARRRR